MIRYIRKADHVVPVSSTTLQDSLREILDRVIPQLPPCTRDSLCDSIMKREELQTTVLRNGSCFPRAECNCVEKIVCGVGVSEKGIDSRNGQQPPVHFIFVSLYPKSQFKRFVTVLGRLVRFSKDPKKMALLKTVPYDRKAFAVIRNESTPWGIIGWLKDHLVLPSQGVFGPRDAAIRVRHG